jgi:hypothetical protein
MFTQSRHKIYAVVLAAPILLLSVSACGASPSTSANSEGSSTTQVTTFASEGSRARLYNSIKELSSDSRLVVYGTAGPHEEVADLSPDVDFTLTTVTIEAPIKPSANKMEGQQIIVRQMGSSRQPTEIPKLVEGETYLLFLTASGLDGDLASQYYITGATAGMYEAAGPVDIKNRSTLRSTPFSKVPSDDGDKLPEMITGDLVTQ